MAIWQRERPAFGLEIASIELGDTTLSASGAAIGNEPLPYWIDYEIATSGDFVTSRLRVLARGDGWRRSLELVRAHDGGWTCKAVAEGKTDMQPPGCDPVELQGALDCDLGFSPLTNSMPILRHGLHRAGPLREFRMAWVAVPSLSVRLSVQRYEFVRSEGDIAIVRYASGDFTSDLSVDSHGLVANYPQLAQRIN